MEEEKKVKNETEETTEVVEVKDNKSKIIISVILVLVLIAIVIIALTLGGKSKKEGENTTKPSTPEEEIANGKARCEKMLSENELLKVYYVIDIKLDGERVISTQASSKTVYKNKEDYNNIKEADKDNKDKKIVYDDATTSATNYFEAERDLTKDGEGKELVLPYEIYRNSLVEQEYECK